MAYLSNIDLSQLTPKDIELCTDYVLYGKDQDNLSPVDRGEIYIKTKYNSYSKSEPVSLEGLMEQPTFDEGVFAEHKNIYKKVKPSIDKEKCKDIPGMKELWETIEMLDHKLKVYQGKEAPKPGEDIPPINSKQLYHMNHQLIEMRKDQYLLKDTKFPEMQVQHNFGNYFVSPSETHLTYPVFPCGVVKEERDPAFTLPYHNGIEFKSVDIEGEVKKLNELAHPYINFLDKEHIYQLITHYQEIKDYAALYPDSLLNNLIWTLDFYVEKANLSPQQLIIVEGKKLHKLNKEICEDLMEELGIYHQENYISTIWNKITGLIAAAADLNYDEWCCKDYDQAWKRCVQCGRILLRDSRNFVRKTKASDGLANRCKVCDQEKRKRNGE